MSKKISPFGGASFVASKDRKSLAVETYDVIRESKDALHANFIAEYNVASSLMRCHGEVKRYEVKIDEESRKAQRDLTRRNYSLSEAQDIQALNSALVSTREKLVERIDAHLARISAFVNKRDAPQLEDVQFRRPAPKRQRSDADVLADLKLEKRKKNVDDMVRTQKRKRDDLFASIRKLRKN